MSDPRPRTPSGVQLLAPLDPRKLIEQAREKHRTYKPYPSGRADPHCSECGDITCQTLTLCDALERALEEGDAAEARFAAWSGTDVPSLNIALAGERSRAEAAEAEVEHFRAVAGQAIDQVEALRAKLALLGEVVEAARVTLATIDQTEIEDGMPGLGAAIRDALARVEQEKP